MESHVTMGGEPIENRDFGLNLLSKERILKPESPLLLAESLRNSELFATTEHPVAQEALPALFVGCI